MQTPSDQESNERRTASSASSAVPGRRKRTADEKNRETVWAAIIVFGSLGAFFLFVLILIMTGKLGTLLNFRVPQDKPATTEEYK